VCAIEGVNNEFVKKTPFRIACERREREIVKKLINSPLLVASVHDEIKYAVKFWKHLDTEICKALLLHDNAATVSLPRHLQGRLLCQACRRGNSELVKFLLDLRFDTAYICGLLRGSPLTFACESGNSEIVKSLLTSPKVDPSSMILVIEADSHNLTKLGIG